MIHRGGCHCGNLRVELESALTLAELPLRACQCSFCRRHGAVSTSDPAGRLRIRAEDPQAVIHYRFGLRTADFLICARCGIYVGAVLEDGGARWGIVNAHVLDEAARLPSAATPMQYAGEDSAGRVDRRKARWTPVAAD